MKQALLFLFAIALSITLKGQSTYVGDNEFNNLPVIFVNENLTLHFRSPEPINYVDISTQKLVGDIPVENIARFKPFLKDSLHSYFTQNEDLGVVTIVGQSFMAQYRVMYSTKRSGLSTEVEILPVYMKPLQFPKVSITNFELQSICLDIQRRSKKMKNVVSKGLGLTARLNNIYSFGDYVFLDLTFQNKTNIKYNVDLISFSIDDKKIYKATNNQSIEVKPFYTLYKTKEFKRSFRNVYVFEKFTFPNDKVLRIRLAERQISGRSLDLLVEYRDLLNADTF
ncbi:MAG: conjugative transposon protein TraN [Bacteroidia bacterium]|nr:conjugative transposon protein TraN [Bacteroidia bacterium]